MTINGAESAILAGQIRAENAQPGFTMRAADFIVARLQQLGEAPGELLVELAQLRDDLQVPDARAFGPVFRTLARQGRIRQVGWCLRRHGHGTGGGRVWRAVA